MQILKTLEERGLIHDVSHPDALAKLLDSEKVVFYCGFDPTADSLHLGSMLPLLVMRRLQRAGHTPIVILGTATGMIGDPSGKSAERKLLTEEEIEQNARGIEAQIKLFLAQSGDNAVIIERNDSWTKNLSVIDFLRDVGKHFSVNMMMQKDSVRTRLADREQGISYTEFSYMLLQAFDYLWLYQNRSCRLQIGGSDQWGNITAGVDLIRRCTDAEAAQAFGLTFPLLTTASGSKFGKTEAGAVWLDAKRTSPYKFYQYWVNTQDADVIRFIKLFTEIEGEELDELTRSVETQPQERAAQRRLAQILTDLVHSESETARAIQASRVLFGEQMSELDERTLLDIFSDVPSTSISRQSLETGLAVADLLVQSGACKSKGDAKRLIESGGAYLNNERLNDLTLSVNTSAALHHKYLVVRSGKKQYFLIKLT